MWTLYEPNHVSRDDEQGVILNDLFVWFDFKVLLY